MNLLPTLLYPLYENHLRRVIKDRPQPRHVAVMCDGNRRWAREAGFADVSHGHRVGAKKIGELIRWCEDTKVEIVTVYLLSTENLKRSSEEVGLLFDIIADVVDELSATDLNCRIRLVGHMDLLPEKISTRMARGAAKTADHTGVVVNIAVGYGGRQEIVDAVQALVNEEAEKGTPADKIADAVTIESLSRHLYTRDQPDPDLVIRTSGEQRLSGFLLWQAAYSEIWFTDTYWPAFRRIDFLRALRDFSSRSRRFGK
ncbi:MULTISPECIES: isoprenyl transferase [Corynebacterium]|uniref:Isoprenyl transferase n=2 Tax=Corynebacterium glucuronolyticum TaxID=39791 RepID=A0A7T4EEU5_9CORY|nr:MULTISPECIES: isoprenyl transferase [Corynebacterium]EEI27477.1 di-trans,poly-cis-decaprenylcistransferase [Corynebacterium glucuronolyticum ATCC 51867]EEI62648.1 di-trans,poly-cis-decaprenylcistransferase [Corynebacterium glucuronolyticum ATCC 51866]MCT1441796.1 isoprenyl transferase [Corynebacterium glucuronolyticum]MCT1562434.1 isoprenyl transferase [Corynebacterium glucuronolyticum]OFO42831.1 isoprenyl transferase [Corynebacterium sp. HMSC073D01]